MRVNESQARGVFGYSATGQLHMAAGKAGLTAGLARGAVRAATQPQLVTSDGAVAAWCGPTCRPNLRVASEGHGGVVLIAASAVNASNASAPGGFSTGDGVFALWPANSPLAPPWPYAAQGFPQAIAAAAGPGAVAHTPAALGPLTLAVGDEVLGVCVYTRATEAAPFALQFCDAGWQAALGLSLGAGADLGARHIGVDTSTGTTLLYAAATLPLAASATPACNNAPTYPCNNTLFRYDVAARTWTAIIAAPAGHVYRGVVGVPFAALTPTPAPAPAPAAQAAAPLGAIIGGAVGGGVLLFVVGIAVGRVATGGRLCPAGLSVRPKKVTPESAARAQSLGAAQAAAPVEAWPPAKSDKVVPNPLANA